MQYCKFKKFLENFIFVNIVLKDLFVTLKNVTGHDLPTSVNKRMISPFHESFKFSETLHQSFEKIKLGLASRGQNANR